MLRGETYADDAAHQSAQHGRRRAVPRGIGPRRSEMLAAHGIRRIARPARLHPLSAMRTVRSIVPYNPCARGSGSWSGGTCAASAASMRAARGFPFLKCWCANGRGSVRVKFFNQPYLRRVYSIGCSLVLYGQVKRDPFAHQSLVLLNPECEILEEDQSGLSVHSVAWSRSTGDWEICARARYGRSCILSFRGASFRYPGCDSHRILPGSCGF